MPAKLATKRGAFSLFLFLVLPSLSCSSNNKAREPNDCTVVKDDLGGITTILCDDGVQAEIYDGKVGSSCTVSTDETTNISTITCEDGTTATVNDGASGSGCTVTHDEEAGTSTITCEDGTSVTITDGETGANGEACTLVDNNNGTATVTCGENTTTIGDSDDDGISDWQDNCPSTTNADQEDANNDGIGDACAADYEGQGPLVPAIIALGIKLENDTLRVPAIVPADGVDGAGNPISVDIYGLDFRYGMSVRLIENEAGDFDAAVDGVIDNPLGGDPLLKIYPLELTYVDASLMTFTLPASPLVTDGTTSERTGDLKVQIVTNSGAVNTAGVSWGEIDETPDQLTYVTSSQNSGGLSGSVALRADQAKLFAKAYPGQSGMVVEVVLTNNTGESISIDSVDNGALSWSGSTSQNGINSAIYNFLQTDLGTLTDVANGASATLRFVTSFAAHLSNFPDEALDASLTVNTSNEDGANVRSISLSGSNLTTTASTPTLSARGGHSFSASAAAGAGGEITINSHGGITLGAPTTITTPNITFAAETNSATTFADDNETIDYTMGEDIELGAADTYIGSEGNAAEDDVRIIEDDSNTSNNILILRVSNGDLYLRNHTWRPDATANGHRLDEVQFVVDGSIYIDNCVFDLAGEDRAFADNGKEDGLSLSLIAGASGDDDAEIVILDSTINLAGGRVFEGAGGSGGALNLGGGTYGTFVDNDLRGSTGPITIINSHISTTGGNAYNAAAGAGGSIDIATQGEDISIDESSSIQSQGGATLEAPAAIGEDEAGHGDINAGAGGAITFAGDRNGSAPAGALILDAPLNSNGGDLLYSDLISTDQTLSAGIAGDILIDIMDSVHIGAATNGQSANPMLVSQGGANYGLCACPEGQNATDANCYWDDLACDGQIGGNGGDISLRTNVSASDNDTEGLFNFSANTTLMSTGGHSLFTGGNAGFIKLNAVHTDDADVDTASHVLAATYISDGGYALLDPVFTASGSAGNGNLILVQLNAKSTVSGTLSSRGGLSQGSNGGTGNHIEVRTDCGTLNGDACSPDAAAESAATLDFAGLIDASGGASFGALAGNAGTIGLSASAHLNISQDASLIANGGIRLDTSSSPAQGAVGTEEAAAGDIITNYFNPGIHIKTTLGHAVADPDSASPITLAGLIQADGSHDLDESNSFGAAGLITIETSEANNDGTITLSGSVQARGDGDGACTLDHDGNITFCFEEDFLSERLCRQKQIAIMSDLSGTSASDINISGNLQTFETTMRDDDNSTKAQIFVQTGFAGDITLSGNITSHRSQITLANDAEGSGAITVSGNIVADHRDISGNAENNGFADGQIVVRNQSTGGISITENALLQANSGSILLTSANQDESAGGPISIGSGTGAATLDASATENPLFETNAINRNESANYDMDSESVCDTMSIWITTVDNLVLHQANLKTNGTDIIKDNTVNNFSSESTANSLGHGGVIMLLMADLLAEEGAVELQAQGAQNVLPNKNLGQADPSDFADTHATTADISRPHGGMLIAYCMGDADADGCTWNNSGNIRLNGGALGRGGTLGINSISGDFDILGSGTIDLQAGDYDSTEDDMALLPGATGGTFVVALGNTGTLTLNKNIDLSGANNSQGSGGNGGRIEISATDNNHIATTTLSGSWNINGGASTHTNSNGGNGGVLLIGDNIDDTDKKFIGPITLDNLEVLANGGAGSLLGGHGGQINIDNDFGSTLAGTITVEATCTMELEAGAGNAADGDPGVLFFNQGDGTAVSLPEDVVSASAIIINDGQIDDPPGPP